MGSISISSLIIFIASIFIATAVAGTLVATVGDISSTAETQGGDLQSSVETNIDILNDGTGDNFYIADGENSQITFYAKNEGSDLSSSPDDFEILLNGRLIQSGNIQTNVFSDSIRWESGDVMEIQIDLDGELEGKNTLSLIVNGNENEIEFIVE